jgi:hypothetical protein
VTAGKYMFNALSYSIHKKNLPAVKYMIEQSKIYLGEMLRIKIITINEEAGEMRSVQDVKSENEQTPNGKIQILEG